MNRGKDCEIEILMSKEKKYKYRYNPVTLSYERVRITFRQRIFQLLSLLASSVGIGFGLMVLYLTFFPSPHERTLREENRQLELNYEILNGKLDQVQSVMRDLQDRDDNIYRVIFEAEPISENVRNAGYGGIDRYSHLEEMGNMDIVIETAKSLDKITKQLYVQSKSFDEIIYLAKNKEDLLRCMPAIQPLRDGTVTRFASGFGYRIHPVYKTIKFHDGVDLTAPPGTKIYATGDGEVAETAYERGYGKMVIINHGFNYKTRYAHMSQILVRQGQKIKRGDVIGKVGNTGTSTGPHLHYEVIRNGSPVNPVNYYMNDLTPEDFDAMVQNASIPNQAFD